MGVNESGAPSWCAVMCARAVGQVRGLSVSVVNLLQGVNGSVTADAECTALWGASAGQVPSVS